MGTDTKTLAKLKSYLYFTLGCGCLVAMLPDEKADDEAFKCTRRLLPPLLDRRDLASVITKVL